MVDDFETDEALKNISLADIKSDKSEDFAEDQETHKECGHAQELATKKMCKNNILSLLFNQGDHPLEHYKKLR